MSDKFTEEQIEQLSRISWDAGEQHYYTLDSSKPIISFDQLGPIGKPSVVAGTRALLDAASPSPAPDAVVAAALSKWLRQWPNAGMALDIIQSQLRETTGVSMTLAGLIAALAATEETL